MNWQQAVVSRNTVKLLFINYLQGDDEKARGAGATGWQQRGAGYSDSQRERQANRNIRRGRRGAPSSANLHAKLTRSGKLASNDQHQYRTQSVRLSPFTAIGLVDIIYIAPLAISANVITLRASEAAAQCIVIAPVCLCLFVGLLPRQLEIACIDRHQTGFVGKGSDHLQLIKFWPSRAPGK